MNEIQTLLEFWCVQWEIERSDDDWTRTECKQTNSLLSYLCLNETKCPFTGILLSSSSNAYEERKRKRRKKKARENKHLHAGSGVPGHNARNIMFIAFKMQRINHRFLCLFKIMIYFTIKTIFCAQARFVTHLHLCVAETWPCVCACVCNRENAMFGI